MSKNDFSKGVEAASKANVDFMNKQAEAIAQVGEKITRQVDEQGHNFDIILDNLNLQEKKDLYNLNDSFNIAAMDKNEKEVLASTLLTLISKYKQNNDNQKEYFLAVKKYLGIANACPDFDLSLISNVDSRNDSKAMYQTVCEFLFLNKADTCFLEEFKEELSYFDINDKTSKQILDSILHLYKNLGLKGIVEHYNFDDASAYDNEIISGKSHFEKNGNFDTHSESSSFLPVTIEIADRINTKKMAWFETKDYFVYCENHKWVRYTKSSKKIESFISFDTAYEVIPDMESQCEIYKYGAFEEYFTDYTGLDRIKFIHNHRGSLYSNLNIDYYQNMLYLLLEDKIHRIDIANDTYNKQFDFSTDKENGPVYEFWVDNNVLLVMRNNSIVTDMISDHFCSKEITDKNGRHVNPSINIPPPLCNNYVYFIPRNGEYYLAEDDNGLGKCLCRFSVKNKLERVCELVRTDYHLYSSCGKIYLISAGSDSFEINMLTSENTIVSCDIYEGNILEIKLYPKYISVLFENKTSFMLYIFDCEENQADAVCLAEKEKSRIKHRKTSVNYQIIGNILYYDILINGKIKDKRRFRLEKTLFDHFNPFIV